MSYCYLHWPEESLCKLKMMMTFIKVKGQQRSNVVNYVLWLPYLVTRTAEAMVKESKIKERSNFTKYRRNVRLCSDLFTDLVIQSQSATVYFFCTFSSSSYTVAVCDCVFLLYDFFFFFFFFFFFLLSTFL